MGGQQAIDEPDIEDYVAGILPGQIQISYEEETLKAQAVLLEKVMKGILVSWVTPLLVFFLEEASENNCWLTGHV